MREVVTDDSDDWDMREKHQTTRPKNWLTTKGTCESYGKQNTLAKKKSFYAKENRQIKLNRKITPPFHIVYWNLSFLSHITIGWSMK